MGQSMHNAGDEVNNNNNHDKEKDMRKRKNVMMSEWLLLFFVEKLAAGFHLFFSKLGFNPVSLHTAKGTTYQFYGLEATQLGRLALQEESHCSGFSNTFLLQFTASLHVSRSSLKVSEGLPLRFQVVFDLVLEFIPRRIAI